MHAQSPALTEDGPVTLLLHKPAGFATEAHTDAGAPQALALLDASSQVESQAEDASARHALPRHFDNLQCCAPLPIAASGLVVYTQDRRIARKLKADGRSLEQECLVEVTGAIAADGLQALRNGITLAGRPLPPIKASWQSENRLRFALKGLEGLWPGQLPALCAALGLTALAIRRIRIGRIPLAKLPAGRWRFLTPWEKF